MATEEYRVGDILRINYEDEDDSWSWYALAQIIYIGNDFIRTNEYVYISDEYKYISEEEYSHNSWESDEYTIQRSTEEEWLVATLEGQCTLP